MALSPAEIAAAEALIGLKPTDASKRKGMLSDLMANPAQLDEPVAWTTFVAVCTDADKPDSNRMMAALALQPGLTGTFEGPCSATGNDPATHWGTHAWNWDYPELDDPRWDTVDWAAYGITKDRAQELLYRDWITSRNGPEGPTGSAHYDGVLTANGLQRIIPPEPT